MVKLQHAGGFDTNCQSRSIMVGNNPPIPARESNCSSNSRLDYLLGCFQTGMGASWGNQPTGGLWSEKESKIHNCILTQGSLLCTEVLSPDSNEQSHLAEIRQYHGSIVPKQVGGHSLPSTSPSGNNDLGLVREEKSISSSTAYPRQDQCGSGYRVPGEVIVLNKSQCFK